jgi:hypothetical protein
VNLRDVVVAFLDEDGWPHGPGPDDGVIETAFQGEHGRWKCHVVVAEAVDQVRCYSIVPMPAGAAARVWQLREAVALANWDLPIGNFEVSADGTVVRCKTAIDVGGDELTPALLRHVGWGNVATMDRYLPAFEAVASGAASPADAVAAAEG